MSLIFHVMIFMGASPSFRRFILQSCRTFDNFPSLQKYHKMTGRHKEWTLTKLISQNIEASIGGLPGSWKTYHYLVKDWPAIIWSFCGSLCGLLTTYKWVPAGYWCAVTEKTIFHAIIFMGSIKRHLQNYFAKSQTFVILLAYKNLTTLTRLHKELKQI